MSAESETREIFVSTPRRKSFFYSGNFMFQGLEYKFQGLVHMFQVLEHKFQGLEYKKVLGEKTFLPCPGNFFSQVLGKRQGKLSKDPIKARQNSTEKRKYSMKTKQIQQKKQESNGNRMKTKTNCPPKVNDRHSGDNS